MPLPSGTRLGPYEILSPLGAGGMGEVYRARDSRLGRDVAIKVLPPHLAGDVDALARFEREARSVAALNHPHILAIFDFGRDGLTTYAATELLEGQTLREHTTEGRLPLRRALEIARQVAAGLAAAHDKGIVHRDLKPENVFIMRDGGAKILDFGLARSAQQVDEGALTQAPTVNARTDAGTILGTVGYMAPEQVRGREVDHRADIFAFGAMLYELLSGVRAFRAETTAEIMTAILREDPPELTPSAAGLNPALDRLVRRCLEKDPEHRFRSARDLGFALDAIGSGSDTSQPATEVPAARPSARRLPLAIVAALAVAIAFALGFGANRWLSGTSRPLTVGPPTVFSVDANFVFAPSVAVSPDGQVVAYTAPLRRTAEATGVAIWLRRLDEVDARPLPTISDNPRGWSADGRSLLVTGGGVLATIDVETGRRTALGPVSGLYRGAVSLPDDTVLAGNSRGILHLRPGGAERVVIPLDTTRDAYLSWPSLLPDGRRFLYVARPRAADAQTEVRIGTLDGSAPSMTVAGLEGVSSPTYLPPAGIAYVKAQVLYAQDFDPARGTLSGSPVVVSREVFESVAIGFGAFSVSSNGVIAYRTERFPAQAFLWVDRAGRVVQEFPRRDTYTNFDLSPDAARVAVTVRRASGAPNLMWLLDLTRGVATNISEPALAHSDATWSPDGERLAFRLGASVVTRAVNGGPLTRVQDTIGYPETWSPDGRYLVVGFPESDLTYSLRAVDLTGREPPLTLVDGIAGLDEPRFSPNGRWMTYNDVEGTKQVQVYAIPFPPTGQRYQLSTAGGTQARWRADGRELYYLATDGYIMSVEVPDGDVRRAAPPVSLFHAGLESSANFDQFAPGRDGQRFLLRRPPEGGGDRAPLSVIVNFDRKTWTAPAERRPPTP